MDMAEVSTGSREGNPDTTKNKLFRLLDDDSIIYFEGIAELDKCDSEEGFDPLDDFGMPSYGCTEIQYKELDGWETL